MSLFQCFASSFSLHTYIQTLVSHLTAGKHKLHAYIYIYINKYPNDFRKKGKTKHIYQTISIYISL